MFGVGGLAQGCYWTHQRFIDNAIWKSLTTSRPEVPNVGYMYN